jgi:hypothetical protein
MKTESQAWLQLQNHAADQLSPGFADRVLRAVRSDQVPLFVAHFGMALATAVLCLGAVLLFHARSSSDSAATLAGWSEIAAQASDFDQGL